MSEHSQIPVFLDCDPGIDDAVALGYLVCQPDAEVVGVATSAGNVSAAQVAHNALAWLRLAGFPDIPVHQGVATPFGAAPEDPVVYADDTHGPAGAGHAVLPDPASGVHRLTSAEAWVAAAHAHPGELIAVVTGPCTNLALALEQQPRLPQLIKRVFLMGGAFNYRGNTKPTTEWNTDFDPDATQAVYAAFGQAVHLPVINPLEATEAVIMTPESLKRIRSGPGDPQWRMWLDHLAEALRFYFEFHQLDGHGYLAHVHDPYVLAAALHWARATHQQPDQSAPVPWAQTATTAVDVELTGTLTRGETVADWLGRWGKPPNAELVRSIDAESFLHHLIDTLRRGPTT